MLDSSEYEASTETWVLAGVPSQMRWNTTALFFTDGEGTVVTGSLLHRFPQADVPATSRAATDRIRNLFIGATPAVGPAARLGLPSMRLLPGWSGCLDAVPATGRCPAVG